MATSKEKIIITGAGGLLGSALCSYFKDKANIIGLSHPECDITDKNQIEEKIIRQKPDIIINPAAFTNVDECEKNPNKAYNVNVEGAKNLTSVCRRLDCLIVHISTDYVFDGEKDSAYTEEDTPRPISIYSKTKLEGEEVVKRSLKKFFIIRSSWLFGKEGKDFVDTIINKIKNNIPLRIANDKFSIPTYNFDLARALGDLISKTDNYGIYHITNSGACSWYDFAKETASLYLKKDIEIEAISINDLNFLARRPRNSVLDNNKFYKAIGYKLRPWQEALKEYINKLGDLTTQKNINSTQF